MSKNDILIDESKPEIVDEVVDESGSTMANDVIDEGNGNASKLPKQAIVNDDGSITLPLRKSVQCRIRDENRQEKDIEYKELTFNYLTGGDLRAIQNTSKDMVMVVMFSRSTRIPEQRMNKLFDQLHAADIKDADLILGSFM